MTQAKKRCGICNRKKARHLYVAKQWNKKKHAPVCKHCQKNYSEAYRKSLDTRYRKTYGITLEEYEALLEFQGGKCAICRKKPGRRRLAVDHDHAVEEIEGSRASVRGLLCYRCNEFLGHIRDYTDPVLFMLVYLQESPVKQSGVLQ